MGRHDVIARVAFTELQEGTLAFKNPSTLVTGDRFPKFTFEGPKTSTGSGDPGGVSLRRCLSASGFKTVEKNA